MQKKFNTQGDKLNDEARGDLLKQIDSKKKILQRNYEDANTDIQAQQNEIANRIGQKLVEVLDKFAKDNNFTLILDVSGQSSPVLWAASSVDITKPVVEAYNAQSGVAAPVKPPCFSGLQARLLRQLLLPRSRGQDCNLGPPLMGGLFYCSRAAEIQSGWCQRVAFWDKSSKRVENLCRNEENSIVNIRLQARRRWARTRKIDLSILISATYEKFKNVLDDGSRRKTKNASGRFAHIHICKYIIAVPSCREIGRGLVLWGARRGSAPTSGISFHRWKRARRQGKLPAECPLCRFASCGACLLFASPAAYVCARCHRRNTWR